MQKSKRPASSSAAASGSPSIAAFDPESIALWEHYVDRWTWLNTVRTAAATGAANLAALGAAMLAGLVRPAWAPLSTTLALTVFLAFPLGRLVGLAVDGMPSSSVLAALAIELVIGALCVAAFGRRGRALAAPGESPLGSPG